MKVAIIPDLHTPYENVNAVTGLYAALEAENKTRSFDYVIQIGDARDMYAFSKFTRTHNLYTAKQELEIATDKLSRLWKTVHVLCPQAKLIQMQGNHEERLPKRVLERLPEVETLIHMEDLFSFPHVTSIFEEELILDDVLYVHGFFTRPYQHLRYYLRSCVFGHTHHAWILFEKIDALAPGRTPHREGLLFEMTCGFLGDGSMIPLRYTATKTNKWAVGFGIVEDGVPRFIPL